MKYPFSREEIHQKEKDEQFLTQEFMVGLLTREEFLDAINQIEDRYPAVLLYSPSELRTAFEIIGITEPVATQVIEDLIVDYNRANRSGIPARFTIQFYQAENGIAISTNIQAYLGKRAVTEQETKEFLAN